LMHQPKVLFLDEPTTGLDPISRQNLWAYLRDLRRRESITVFLTTHYLEEAEGSDYLCIIDNGKVVARGSPTEIKEKLIKRFVVVDASDRKKLQAELKQQGWQSEGKGPFKIDLDGQTGQALLKKMKTPLTYLDIHNPSLEEAYVEIITGKHADD